MTTEKPKGNAPTPQFDDVLKRMLASPPAPHKAKKAAKPAKNKPAK